MRHVLSLLIHMRARQIPRAAARHRLFSAARAFRACPALLLDESCDWKPRQAAFQVHRYSAEMRAGWIQVRSLSTQGHRGDRVTPARSFLWKVTQSKGTRVSIP